MKRISIVILLGCIAWAMLALEPARIDIKFNPATDGPIIKTERRAQWLVEPTLGMGVSVPLSGPSTICATTMAFAGGSQGMAVLTPCTPSIATKRE